MSVTTMTMSQAFLSAVKLPAEAVGGTPAERDQYSRFQRATLADRFAEQPYFVLPLGAGCRSGQQRR